MNNRKIWFYGSLITMLIILLLLVTGSDILTISMNDKNTLPLGTLITWVGIISLPVSIYWGSQEFRKPTNLFYKCLSVILLIFFVLAILWVPICYWLAGNFSFTFTEKETFRGGQLAMKWFWRFSYAIPIGLLALLVTFWMSLLIQRDNYLE